MTTDLHPFPFDGRRAAFRTRWPDPTALTAAALCVASLAYTAAITITGGWLATTKVWFTWPTYTLLNLAAMLAALAAAELSRRELKWQSGNWTALNVIVFAVSVMLCIAFVLSLVLAAVAAFLSASDDESDSRIRFRSGSRQRHQSRRSRSRRRSSYRNHRRRYW